MQDMVADRKQTNSTEFVDAEPVSGSELDSTSTLILPDTFTAVASPSVVEADPESFPPDLPEGEPSEEEESLFGSDAGYV
eukprot:1503236-Amphidinium_carterae.1